MALKRVHDGNIANLLHNFDSPYGEVLVYQKRLADVYDREALARQLVSAASIERCIGLT